MTEMRSHAKAIESYADKETKRILDSLIRRREALFMSIADMSKLSGIKYMTAWSVENGKAKPSMKFMLMYEKALYIMESRR